MLKILNKILGDGNEREVKKLQPVVDEINALEPEFEALSDEALRAKTDEFKRRLDDGEELDDLLAEAFATVRESAKRAIGQRHFDVQLIGGTVLHQGKIAEMRTGEGKTLVSTLPLYLNALTGKGVHLVTVNDYLAKRDCQWMGPIFTNLGLSLSCLQHESAFLYVSDKVSDVQNMEHLVAISRREAYAADITYGTNHEFGFDYLRDNMAVDEAHTVQRGHYFAIVDEADNILIDEARTPLIISGPAEENTQIYFQFARIVPRLAAEEDYTVDERLRAVTLTEEGTEKLEKALGIPNIYAPENYRLTRYMEAALKAQVLFHRDRDYVVRDGEVVIVDDFTGRLMFGRRWSDGLHQAVEAKEGVKIQQESITYATITLQNYFRMYDKLAGMTGTAMTESEELHKIYELDVMAIPTNRATVRDDMSDLVFRSQESKFRNVVVEIQEQNKTGRPVLVGTVAIETSEYISDLLKRQGVPHQVLNAKFHEHEAAIVAQAGRLGTVTIATNMAGRGTDIILGGNPQMIEEEFFRRRAVVPGESPSDVVEQVRQEARKAWQEEHDKVVELGGLYIMGTERHESRRIDNQLRGRAGRQGDPGSTRFFVSLSDDLMKRFAPEWLGGMMQKLGMEEDTPIESGWVTKAIENAQTKVEGHNFDLRKNVVEYDDVMNMHRDVIYDERAKILEGADVKANVVDMVHEEITSLVESLLAGRQDRDWDIETLLNEVNGIVRLPADFTPEAFDVLSRDEVLEKLITYADQQYDEKERAIGPENQRLLERLVLLKTIDSLWVEHLTAVDEMRQGIGLQAYGQVDPLVAYKKEAHDMWGQLLANIRRQVTRTIYMVELAPAYAQPARTSVSAPQNLHENRAEDAAEPAAAARRPTPSATRKVGRNDPCPCGSGRKYKKCHGAAVGV